MNTIAIHGRLVRDPETKSYYNKKGDENSLCNFTVAVDRRMDAEKADFFNCTIFGKRAEVINKFFSKGSEIALTGEMQMDNYEDSNGNKRTAWKIIVNDFDFCGSKSDKAKSGSSVPSSVQTVEAQQEDDLPF